ncbi:MAG: aminotransferase class V-fold PLP-dependent enzyme [Acetobacteraceae bacterium]|nr:aminotransferase class V-fold PLP-dependent enzyme [Acetobacteraceae bacterium]
MTTLHPTLKQRGRIFFANPGPTNIPESVLRAIDHASVDHNDPGFMEVYADGISGLKRVLRTGQELFMYASSGHGAWEASFLNLLSPGDTVLILESGHFSNDWALMGRQLNLAVRMLPADWRRGADMGNLQAVLRADTTHAIKAVCAVHNETSTGVALSVPDIRAAIDATQHPALYLVDTISSLGSLDFRMDEWGVDCVVGSSQKGLMLPTGMSFTGVSAKAMAAHGQAELARYYFDWSLMLKRPQKSFIGTVPTSLFYGLRESLRLLEEEGLDAVFARHARLGQAVRRAVQVWSGNNGPQLYCTDPARTSNSVTAILMPEGHDADVLRRTALGKYNVSLGGGLGPLSGKVFRIGHLGDLNEPMILGTLAGVEMALAVNKVPHGAGGVAAAMAYLASTTAA